MSCAPASHERSSIPSIATKVLYTKVYMAHAKKISYIFPIYNESGNIPLLHKTLDTLLKERESDYVFELIFINDGSKDDSLELLKDLAKKDRRITVINFARNFGHQIAVTAGLDYASGDAVIIMDSDMQDPPRVSFSLIDKWLEGNQVVYAQRRTRKDSAFKRATAYIFYWLLQKLSTIDIPRNTGDFRLLDRKVVDQLKQFKEHDRFLRGMVSFVGFKQAAVEFDRDERHAGETGYPLRKMIRFAVDGIFGFSTAPLTFISTVGYVIAALSVVGIIYVLIMKIFFASYVVSGWTFLAISIFFLGGVQLIMLGIIGGYIARIYTESLNRPLYIVDEIIKK